MSVKLFEPIGNYFIKQVERDIKYAVISAKQFICTGYACVQPTYDMNGNTISVKVFICAFYQEKINGISIHRHSRHR